MKLLFQTNINALTNVYRALHNSQTLSGRLVILQEPNEKLLKEAEQKISEAIALLNKIK